MHYITTQKDYNSLKIFFRITKYLGFTPTCFDIQEGKKKCFNKTVVVILWLLMFLGCQYLSVNQLTLHIKQLYLVTGILRSILATSEVLLFVYFISSYLQGKNWTILIKKITDCENQFTKWSQATKILIKFSRFKILLLFCVHLSFILLKHYDWYSGHQIYMMIVTVSSRFIDLFELQLNTFCILIVGWAQARYNYLIYQLKSNRKITNYEVLKIARMYKSCGEVIEQSTYVIGGLIFGTISRNIELFLLVTMYGIDDKTDGRRDALINSAASATYAVSSKTNI